MAWDFETDPEYQAQLDWADEFVREEVEPLDLVWRGRQFSPPDDRLRQVIDPLKDEVRKRRLWATHLKPELGGEGHGQVKLSLPQDIGVGGEPLGGGHHALIHYEDVRVPADALLGGEGQAFAIAQTRLGGGRIHHAMRTIGLARKALDMMCERALSRTTQGSLLAEKQFVQGYIADSYAQLVQFRLFVLYTAWSIDKHNDYRKVRKDIATAKVVMPTVLHDIAWRAMQVHGALGVSNEMPFLDMILGAGVMGLADGPTEVHKVTVARQVLRDYKPSDDVWPTQHLPKLRDAARAKLADYLEHDVGNL